MRGIVVEVQNSAVLDSEATKTVFGQNWYNAYLQSLSAAERLLVTSSESNNMFRFGDGQLVQSTKTVQIPVQIAGKKIKLETDIIDKDIPLLLSRMTMKRAGMSIDFENDVVTIFGILVQLNITKSGHYTLPLTSSVQLLTHQRVCKGVNSLYKFQAYNQSTSQR